MNSKSTAEAVLRLFATFVNNYISEFKVYCGSGIETRHKATSHRGLLLNSNSTAEAVLRLRCTFYKYLHKFFEFKFYCGSGKLVNRQQVLVLNRIFVYGVKPAALDKSR